MANPGYVRSTDGNDADNGSTWALANATLAGATADDAAGDTIYVSQNHAESTAGAVSLTWAGSKTSPQKIICANDAAEPPTAVATSGTVTTTGNSAIGWGSSSTQYTYVYGLTFTSGSGASGAASISMNGNHTFESCNFVVGTTGSTSTISTAGSNANQCKLISCGFKFSAAGQSVTNGLGSTTNFDGCSLLSGGTSPTNFFTIGNAGSVAYFDGLDLVNASAGVNLVTGTSVGARVVFLNAKLPASWSGAPHSSTPGHGSSVELINCDSGDTNYRYRKAAAYGTIQEETTLVRTGGASDGTTTFSLKLVTNADAEYPHLTLDTPELAVWNDTTGSSKTATVEILHDSVTALTDAEIWLEAQYLGTSGFPLSSFINDCKADVLATAANQTSSSETWTTTGMSNPNKQKLSVTFTPQEKGPVYFVVRMAKASYTCYIDPEVAIA